MNQQDINQLRKILGVLAPLADECWETPGGCTDVNPCTACLAQDAIKEVEKMTQQIHLPLEHYVERLAYNGGVNGEAYLLKLWLAENIGVPGTNGGKGVLEGILGHKPGVRDAEVAASVICWLGTNCGSAFLRQLLDARKQAETDASEKRTREHEEKQAARLQEIEEKKDQEEFIVDDSWTAPAAVRACLDYSDPAAAYVAVLRSRNTSKSSWPDANAKTFFEEFTNAFLSGHDS